MDSIAKRKGKNMLYSSHEELLNNLDKKEITEILKRKAHFEFTDNIQYQFYGFKKIMNKFHDAKFVVTTRLHGAIIAYGLGIPYLAVSFDNKLDEFNRLYGNGVLLNNLDELKQRDIQEDFTDAKYFKPNLIGVKDFGKKANIWRKSILKHTE